MQTGRLQQVAYFDSVASPPDSDSLLLDLQVYAVQKALGTESLKGYRTPDKLRVGTTRGFSGSHDPPVEPGNTLPTPQWLREQRDPHASLRCGSRRFATGPARLAASRLASLWWALVWARGFSVVECSAVRFVSLPRFPSSWFQASGLGDNWRLVRRCGPRDSTVLLPSNP